MKYRIDLSEKDYFDLITVLVLAYAKPYNSTLAKGLLQHIVNNHIKVDE